MNVTVLSFDEYKVGKFFTAEDMADFANNIMRNPLNMLAVSSNANTKQMILERMYDNYVTDVVKKAQAKKTTPSEAPASTASPPDTAKPAGDGVYVSDN